MSDRSDRLEGGARLTMKDEDPADSSPHCLPSHGLNRPWQLCAAYSKYESGLYDG